MTKAAKTKETKRVNVREFADQYQQNCARITEICDLCEAEQRERNEAEEREYQSLLVSNQQLQMRMQAASSVAQAVENYNPVTRFREAMQSALAEGSRNPVVLHLTREGAEAPAVTSTIQGTDALAGTGIIPVKEGEMIKPLRAGLIYDKVGLKIRTGLVGTLRWPKHGKLTAQWVGEKEALTPTSVDWDKIEVAPKRLGVAADVTRQEIFQSEGIVEDVIREEIPQAIIDKVNAALFTTDATGKVVYGPFAKAGQIGGCKKVPLTTAVPTRRDLLLAKADVAKQGISTAHCCWVMTEVMKAELEATPLDSGSGRFLCEDGKVLGYPVFTTDEIGDSNIGFGDWSYQAAGFFGQMNMVVDPYTLALNDATRFVLNTDFATVTLRPEAFVLIACKKTE